MQILSTYYTNQGVIGLGKKLKGKQENVRNKNREKVLPACFSEI